MARNLILVYVKDFMDLETLYLRVSKLILPRSQYLMQFCRFRSSVMSNETRLPDHALVGIMLNEFF